MYIADLHIHSRYSRATSKDGTPEYLDLWARRKGIHIVGTGDFTHPAWRQELEDKLTPAEEGLYFLKDEFQVKSLSADKQVRPRFVISGEISSIYKKNGKVRKVHSLILLPGLEEAGKLSKKLEAIGNIHSDGRPILGLDCRDLLEITLEICPKAMLVPAHIWTPHFSMFGAFSGFDTVEECFEDLTDYIHAVETGLSSDPPMNWRLSALDRFQLISNSDAHSPAKLGREANLLDIEMSYDGLYQAIQNGQGLKGTIEFFPEEGKYHFDGHRKCHLCLSPEEAEQYGGKCPVCGKKLTLGVSHRILQLADRGEGFVPDHAKIFESLVPLPEVIAASTGRGAASANVQRQYEKMVERLGNEFSILREVPEEEIKRMAGSLIAEGIRRLRAGKVERIPGFDGEYGTIKLFQPSELGQMEGQMDMFLMAGWKAIPQKDQGRRIPEAGKKKTETEETDIQTMWKKERELAGDNQTDQILDQGDKDQLNHEQLQAVRSISSHIAVIAGPGTGKTKTLVSRIVYLLQNRRVKPSEITAVTFTKKAADELKQRLEKVLGGRQAIRKMQIGTFHAICYQQLKKQGEEFLLLDNDTALELAWETIQELGLKEKPRKLLHKISCIKNGQEKERAVETTGGVGPADKTEDLDQALEEEGDKYGEAFLVYQEKLRRIGALDFDDLLLKALEMPKSQEFSYLLVDELQDISPLEYRLIQAWSEGGRERFLIGDPDQAIYGFRGADPQFFKEFETEEKTEVIRLKKNYRSTPQILTAAGCALPQGDEDRCPKPVKAFGAPVRLLKASREMGEAIFIAKEINRLVGGMDMLDAQEGEFCSDNPTSRGFADIGVLYRTHRQAELLEKCFQKEGIPYIVTGREEFLEEDVVRGSLGFFRSIVNPQDVLSKKQCLKLLNGLDGVAISQEEYEELENVYGGLLKRTQPHKILSRWIKERNLSQDLAMEKLLAMTYFYKTMAEFLDGLRFGGEGDIRRCGGKTYTSDAVTLMTFHGSKGLEFPAVFLYGIRKGTMPLEWGGQCDYLEEERRLLYVGMTRAKEELIMTSSGQESPFLEEFPKEAVIRENIKVKSSTLEGKQLSMFDFIK